MRKNQIVDFAYAAGGVGILLSILLVWQIISETGVVPITVFPPASSVLAVLYGQLLNGKIPWSLFATLLRLLEGYSLAALIGVLVGIPVGLSKTIETTVNPLVQFLRPMPSAVLIPLAILYFGLGGTMIISIITYACIWPILINTIDGVKSIDTMILDTAREFKIDGLARIRKVIIPASFPFIFSGLR
ncbi:MAG: ABC transporter permease subunit, partial [Nitrososphaerota archaeon]|nr:ABC transporter permease subunit [Nitrososphaerota archaeon]